MGYAPTRSDCLWKYCS
ncbi:hypothetical protein DBR27_22370 [Flavobacterium sp. HMWF030]|nr:hypothetical protein DBR27_22370 [Flavobacterium sp. HMWF030]